MGESGPLTEGHVERLRRAELERVKDAFPPRARVLELGGDRGHQASILAAWGSDVVSLDLEEREVRGPMFHPVGAYDGRHVPYGDEAFDVVFTSNVLEHVRDLDGFLGETRRVLRPGGAAVHIVPSATWRFWTSLSHYPYVVSVLLGRERRAGSQGAPESLKGRIAERGWRRLVWRAIVPGPHGEDSSVAAELWHYRRSYWRRRLERNGLRVARAEGAGVFYTGYELFPTLSPAARRRLAAVLGSSCHLFVLTRPLERNGARA